MVESRLKSTWRACAAAGALLVAAAPAFAAVAAEAAAAGAAPALHVPSPDWRDQIIYFAMIDRFDDGDPGNNDQAAGEFDPADGAKFSGGDLAGLTRRLDYIRGLGATAVWITPPVRNQWWNATTRYGGYHGYWATDFKAVDPHFGVLADYRQLSRALHGAGMRLIQDVVVNHTANYFAYPAGAAPTDPAREVRLLADSTGRTAPTQWPFSLNDPRDRLQRAAGIYHWTPDIVDYADRTQELTFQLSGLDDLNTENPLVRAALRDAYGYWIREVGVDGFRVDTAFYVPPAFFSDFLHADDPQAPGIARVAAQTGRRDFHVFGEGFAIDRPYADVMARKIDGYMRGSAGRNEAGQRLLPGMLNFPLYGTLGDVFARGHPTAELAYRIRSTMAVHERPHLMPTFVDNHDVDRFLSSGTEAGLKQALLAIMTLPGIPTLYYGTEQGFASPRAAMFATGHGSGGRSCASCDVHGCTSGAGGRMPEATARGDRRECKATCTSLCGGRDHFDADAPLYRFVQRATALRRGHRVFSRGNPTVLADNAAAPGAFAYRMDHDGEAALVVFNSADRAALLDNLDTGLTPGTVLQGVFAIDGEPRERVVGAAGRISLELPPRSGLVWTVASRVQPVAASTASITLAPPPGMQVRDFSVRGTAVGTARVQLVVDGDLASALPVEVGADGRWQARVDTRDMVDPAVTHSVVAWDADAGVASARQRFTVARDWTPLAEVADPAGDDRGPHGRYAYPSDPGWRDHRQADLRGMRVWGSGGALKVQLRLREVTALWNPANGFDHVAFTLFVRLPGRDGGATVMPQQNATLPDGMRWHVRLRAHGWSNATYAAAGASSSSEGTVVAASARIEVDAGADTVTFTVPARALGNPASLSGAKLYVNTWDYDGGYRALTPTAQAASFGGGDGATDPLFMDDTAVVVLP